MAEKHIHIHLGAAPRKAAAKDASSRAELEQKLRVAQGRYDKLEPGVPLREKVALKQQIDDLKKQLAETKDAAPTESQFKAKVSEINQLLTDASRRCEQLAGQLDAGSLLEKCEKLEDLIDKARNYAFQIR